MITCTHIGMSGCIGQDHGRMVILSVRLRFAKWTPEFPSVQHHPLFAEEDAEALPVAAGSGSSVFELVRGSSPRGAHQYGRGGVSVEEVHVVLGRLSGSATTLLAWASRVSSGITAPRGRIRFWSKVTWPPSWWTRSW